MAEGAHIIDSIGLPGKKVLQMGNACCSALLQHEKAGRRLILQSGGEAVRCFVTLKNRTELEIRTIIEMVRIRRVACKNAGYSSLAVTWPYPR